MAMTAKLKKAEAKKATPAGPPVDGDLRNSIKLFTDIVSSTSTPTSVKSCSTTHPSDIVCC